VATACHRHSAGLAGCNESLDEGDCDGRQLIGRGHPPSRAASREAREAVSDYIAAARPAMWDERDVAGSSILMYHQAHPLPISCMQSSLLLKLRLLHPALSYSLPDVLHMQ
jgi:hypothetical protein